MIEHELFMKEYRGYFISYQIVEKKNRTNFHGKMFSNETLMNRYCTLISLYQLYFYKNSIDVDITVLVDGDITKRTKRYQNYKIDCIIVKSSLNKS